MPFNSDYFYDSKKRKNEYPIANTNVKLETYDELLNSDAHYEFDSYGAKLFTENLSYFSVG